MKNMAYKVVGDIIVSVHNEHPVPDDEAQACLAFLRALDLSKLRMLVVTKGGSPSAAQRRKLHEVLQGQEIMTAIVADGMIVMGVITAMSWFNKNIKSFSIDNIEEAFHYLCVPDTQFSLLRREVNRLKLEVTRPSSSI